jgi:hypothetical protein
MKKWENGILIGWIRIQEGKNNPQKVKNGIVFKCWMFTFESWRRLL